MTGPTGKVMLMPEEKADTDYIMVATGTGIAPYRGFIRRLFTETTPAGEAYKGLAWLFLGVANSDALLYDEEWQAAKSKFPDNFRASSASVLNHRVVLHAIDATPARWRGDAGSSPLNGVITAASSP